MGLAAESIPFPELCICRCPWPPTLCACYRVRVLPTIGDMARDLCSSFCETCTVSRAVTIARPMCSRVNPTTPGY